MSCRFEHGQLVDCTLLDSPSASHSDAAASETEEKQGLFGKLFGKKEGGSSLGNAIRDKEKRENTVKDLLDLGALFGLTKSSSGQSKQDFELQRQLELQRIRDMEARSKQAKILGMPIWAFVLLLGFIILLSIVLIAKLKPS